jgi:hypothetical protein
MMRVLGLSWRAGLLLAGSLLGAFAAPLWPGDGAVEGSWGAQIHFTSASSGELDMLAKSGARWARTDLSWADTEKQPGVYDFSVYVKLADQLASHGMQPWFVLDYENSLYESRRSVTTPAGRAAFAAWAGAAAKALRGRAIIWEIWNEPNNAHFWVPRPDPPAYLALALAATHAIKAADPSAVIVGPALSTADVDFLRACGRAGLIALWDGLSVHPYRRSAPESAGAEFRALRAVIRRYTPAGQTPPPLLVGEWGYSSAWEGMTENLQASTVARTALFDLASGVPLTIWYDWRDDGVNQYNPEDHFGLVHFPYHAGQFPVYDAKPAYEAAAAQARELKNYRLNKVLIQNSGTAFCLLFERRPGLPESVSPIKLAVWTTNPEQREWVTLPIGPGTFTCVDGLGRPLPEAVTTGPSLQMQLTDLPQYLTPATPSPRLRVLMAAERWPQDLVAPAGSSALVHQTWTNRLAESVGFVLGIEPAPSYRSTPQDTTLYASQNFVLESAPFTVPTDDAPLRVRAGADGWWQETWVAAAPPPEFSMTPLGEKGLRIGMPNAAPGRLLVRAGTADYRTESTSGPPPDATVPLRDFNSPYGTLVTATLTNPGGGLIAQQTLGRVQRIALNPGRPGAGTGLHVAPEGPSNIPGNATVVWDNSPEAETGAPAAIAMHVDFMSGTGNRFYRFAPGLTAITAQWPLRVGFWVYGSDTPVRITLRLRDVTGQVFQPAATLVEGKRWQAVWLDLDPLLCERWDGLNDGIPHTPAIWDSYFIIDKVDDKPAQGTIYLLPPTMLYPAE